MLRKKIKKLIAISVLCSALFFSVRVSANTFIKSFQLNPASITYQEKVSRQRVLIYHSHYYEKYADGKGVYEVSEHLSKLLESKGYIVDHINIDFSKDYNKSYQESRKFLLSQDLSQYSLTLDIHRDSGSQPTITNIQGKSYARTMFVGAIQNPNRSSAMTIATTINKNLNTYGSNIYKPILEKNRKTSFYNAELNKNMLLLEIGNDKNTSIEAKNTTVLLSEAIDTYLKSLNK